MMSKDFSDCNISELTIRDFFAAVALHAFICKGGRADDAANRAYSIADVVLCAREYERDNPEDVY